MMDQPHTGRGDTGRYNWLSRVPVSRCRLAAGDLEITRQIRISVIKLLTSPGWRTLTFSTTTVNLTSSVACGEFTLNGPYQSQTCLHHSFEQTIFLMNPDKYYLLIYFLGLPLSSHKNLRSLFGWSDILGK